MQSKLLHDALRGFAAEASQALQAELAAGAEIPFELAGGRGARGRVALQLYSPMTGAFLDERWPTLLRLPGHGPALRALEAFRGLDRYVASLQPRSPARSVLADRALRAFTADVFHEQSDFALHEGRLRGALTRLDAAEAAQSGSLTLVASLHGLVILSPQLQLADRLVIARPDTLSGVPEQALAPLVGDGAGTASGRSEPLLVVLDVPEPDARMDLALDFGKELLRELLRALRLYGDGRIALGPMAFACVGDRPFTPLALGLGGHAQGALVVRAEQEDELRAFCSLIARRAPREDALAWALRRFELGCERADEMEGLSDHLLALQALLEPERVAAGLLAARAAALCAPPERRQHLAARVLRAVELERDVARGQAIAGAGALELARELAGHVKSLLRDVICGHLQPDLIARAEELMRAGEEPTGEQPVICPAEQPAAAAEETTVRTAKRPKAAAKPRAARGVARARAAAPVEEETTRVLRARRSAASARAQAQDPEHQSALPI